MTKQDLKFALTHGGVLKDSQGKWMMHGDKVRYTDLITAIESMEIWEGEQNLAG